MASIGYSAHRRHQLIEHGRKEMVVHVPVDRQRPSIAKGLEETLDLSSQLQPNLRAQRAAALAPASPCAHSAAKLRQNRPRWSTSRFTLRRGRERPALEQIQVQRHREARTAAGAPRRHVPSRRR